MKSHLSKSSLVICLFFFYLFSCTTSPTQTNHENLSSSSEPQSGLETIAILGTNDIHGTLAPLSLKSRENPGAPSIEYEAAGTSTLTAYVNRLRAEFGNHLIWLDAGDEFQGSIDSNTSEGAPMVQFFNYAKLNAAAIGNHEFDFGLNTLRARMKEALYPYLAANINEKASGQPASFPNTYPHTLVQAGKLKVGVIGLSTLDTPRTTRAINVKELQFSDLKTAVLHESEVLHELGAQVILITAHVGLKCDIGNAPIGHMMRKPSDPQGDCGDQDEMVRLLRSLPLGTVDAVVAGHSHQVVHHWVAGIPVIQGGAFGRYLNLIYLTYDWSQQKLLTDETRIEGPIPVCAKVFQNQNDCNGDRPAPKNGRGPLVTAQFHGEPVQPDSEIKTILKPFFKKAELLKTKVLGQAIRPLEHVRTQESGLGNLVADAVRQAVHADFALVNSGGIRTSIESGPITYGAVFQALPFENQISKIQVTGKDLKLILRVAESGSRGFAPVSGVRLKLIALNEDAPQEDLNGDGKMDVWETNRILEMTFPNGDPIEPDHLYTFATIDFLVTGGDDLGWPMSQLSTDRIQMSSGITVRDAVAQYIEHNTPLNSVEHPLVDSAHPRFVFEKIRTQKQTKKKFRHSKKAR